MKGRLQHAVRSKVVTAEYDRYAAPLKDLARKDGNRCFGCLSL